MKKIGKNCQAKRCAPSGLALLSPNTVFMGDFAFKNSALTKVLNTKGAFHLANWLESIT
jgi:hypothetical protein